MQYIEISYEGTDPSEFTREFGLEPTRIPIFYKTAREGKPPNAAWVLRSITPTDELFTKIHLSDLFRIMDASWDKFVRMGKLVPPTLSIVMELSPDESTPPLEFDQEDLKRLVDLNATVDVDIYVMRESADDDTVDDDP